MAKIQASLAEAQERYGLQFTDDIWEMNTAVVRDAIVSMGLDPGDRSVLESMLLGSFLALANIINSAVVIGGALPLTMIQCVVLRRWLDGEVPISRWRRSWPCRPWRR